MYRPRLWAVALAALLVLVALPVMTGSARAAVNPDIGVAATVFDGDLDVFYTGQNEGLWEMPYVPGSGWHAAAQVPGGGVLTSAPAVDVWRGGNELDVFGRSTDNAMWQTAYTNGRGWLGYWLSLGGGLTSGPAADVSSGGTQVNTFVTGGSGVIYQNAYTDAGGWTNWVVLPGPGGGGAATSAPATDVYRNQVDVWARGTDDGLWQKYYAGGWTGWGEIAGTGGELASAPTSVVSPNGLQLDVFYVGANGGLWDVRYTGSAWEAPVPIPGTAGLAGSAPSAVAYQGSLDLFFLSSNAGLLEVSSSNGGASWSAPLAPAPPVPAPAPVTVAAPTPTPTPAPPPTTSTSTIKPSKKHGRRPRVKAALKIKWKWNAHGTRVTHVKTVKFPPKARITISCSGHRCPVTMSSGWRDLGRLWRRLEHHWFHRRDKVVFKITQRGHAAERAQFKIRHGRAPVLKQR